MISKLTQVTVAFCLTAGYALKLNDTLPACVGTVLDSSHADDWRCDKFGGTVGSDEKKCAEHYEAGTGGQVHRQCTVHKASEVLFNCLASTPCKVKTGYSNTCSCPNGVAAAGISCTEHNSVICASCESGYDLSGGSCTLRTCTCKNGKGSVGANCPGEGQEDCASCAVFYELKKEDGKNVCKSPFGDIMATLAGKAAEERTAVAWGDPHVKVFDYQYKNKADRFTNFHHGWDRGTNLNVMEPGTYWFVKTPGNLISIQGVYGWGWRAVIRNVAVSGLFIKNDVIQVFPKHKTGPSQNTGLYYQYKGASRSRVQQWGGAWEWQNDRKDVSIKWAQNTEGLNGKNQFRCKLTLPLYVELILNIYNHHMDVVLTMRPIDAMWGDMGNINGDASDEMKWNPPSIHNRNKYWYQMTTAHGTRVAQTDNLFPFWYDVPRAPHGAKTTALLAANKSSAEQDDQNDDDQNDDHMEQGSSSDSSDVDGEPDEVVVDGVELKNRAGPLDSRHDCTKDEETAAKKLCHEMFKVNNSVAECVADVCQQGPKMAEKAEIVEVETEESEEEEKPEHYKIYSGGQLYKSCFNAEEHFSKLAAMPRDARELGFIKEQAVQPTLLGGKCAGQKWVYLDGTSVPGAVISSSCVDGQLLCVQGQTVSACDGAKKIACQIPRLYTCKAEVPAESMGTACPGGMQLATPKSVREKEEAQKAMDSALCTTKQAWTGFSDLCFEEGKQGMQSCTSEAKTVMCETKFD
ncbi:unnamed protein product [Cladocopium goreaui]|uniref:PA14 domain-containing protein n=1 Tax=Cladocopium goreaui TaxID=2562237 RepID=A0A9P1BNE3_9DINO|nr:unnamed protein product [Cladocopium goreaui]|mmetsp:Transcript_73368/g.162040  ORF Transcript_73368/g.162040 Transcript_73368/m.162040 type:complete len:745 (-) Transcript_73368:72-2306(-)